MYNVYSIVNTAATPVTLLSSANATTAYQHIAAQNHLVVYVWECLLIFGITFSIAPRAHTYTRQVLLLLLLLWWVLFFSRSWQCSPHLVIDGKLQTMDKQRIWNFSFYCHLLFLWIKSNKFVANGWKWHVIHRKQHLWNLEGIDSVSIDWIADCIRLSARIWAFVADKRCLGSFVRQPIAIYRHRYRTHTPEYHRMRFLLVRHTENTIRIRD